MKKVYKILIIIIILIFTSLISFGLGYFVKDKKSIPGKDEITKMTKEEYYTKMEKRMYDYYKIHFRNTIVEENDKDRSIKSLLENLEMVGFPMEDFVSYDGKEKCDTKRSFAIRKVVDNKYVISVYYKCGNDANYNYNEPTTKNSIRTTETIENNSN